MATIKLNDTNKIVIDSFKTDKGKFLNIRKFYLPKDSEEWLPTRQGITVPEEKAPKFIKLFKEELADIDENARELEARDKGGKKKKGKAKDDDDDEDEKPKKKKKKARKNEDD